MRDVIPDIDRWLREGKTVAVATVVATWGSAPRSVSARMAVSEDQQIAGSVSGGCVEGAVVEAGLQVLENSQAQLLHFGVADETAWDVGLACGGNIEVFVQPLDESVFLQLRKALNADLEVTRMMAIRGPSATLGQEAILLEDGSRHGNLSSWLIDAALGTVDPPKAGALRWSPAKGSEASSMDEDVPELFIEHFAAAPQLILVGGVHISIALAELAKPLGFRTIVIDPRKAFGTRERFPGVDRLIQEWPDKAMRDLRLTSSTAIVMLTHDPKIDDPALRAALVSPAFYVGGLGSKSTQAKRVARLKEYGLEDATIARLHGPVGLDLGGRTPEEIAVAIVAQIVAARHGMLDERGGVRQRN